MAGFVRRPAGEATGYAGQADPGPAAASLPGALSQLDAPPIFVVGHPRSGTTWVYDVLVEHPEVAGVLESWLFSKGAGLFPLLNRRHWDAQALGDEFGQSVGLGALASRAEVVEEVRQLTARLLARALTPEHRFLVEKTPVHHDAMEAIAEVFPEARFIHVVRDGRDVTVSFRAATGSWLAWNASGSAFDHARAWVRTIRTAREAGARLGDRFMEVRYEDLKEDPVGHAGRLFDFCGIPCERELLERICAATAFDRRFAGGADRFRRAGRVGDWRDALGPLDILRHWRGAGRGIVEAGYEDGLAWPLRALPRACAWRLRRSLRRRA